MSGSNKRSSHRRTIFEQLTFVKLKGHIEIEKQIGQRRFHLSWDNPAALKRELEAFLEAQRRHISLADFLAQVAESEAPEHVRLPGSKGQIELEEFCRKILPEYRGRMAGWKRELSRINWILANGRFSRRALHSIRPREIADFYQDYARRPEINSDNTRAHMIQAIRAIFRTAFEVGYLRDNPSTGMKMPGIPETNQRALTRGEAERLVLGAEIRVKKWILLPLYTGLRPIELSRLRVGHVDIGERRLRVVGRTAKNRTRDIYIHDEIYDILKERAAAVPNLPLLRDDKGGPEPFPRTIFARARGWASLADISLYTMRHTFATWLLETGTRDEETRAVLLGHRLSRMSARYTHVTFEMIREAIKRLPRVTAAPGAATSAGAKGS